MPKENLTRAERQLVAIGAMTTIQKQFVGTMIDTEVAAGCFLRKTNTWGSTWVAYIAVKMKYPGDLGRLATLVSPSKPRLVRQHQVT